jgi:p-methyltransferase
MGKTVAVIAPMVDVMQYHLDLNLRLKGSNRELTLATIEELIKNGYRTDLLQAIPSKRDMMPAAGFYLAGLLRSEGYQVELTYRCTPESLEKIARSDPFAVCLSTTMILSTESLQFIVNLIRRFLPETCIIVGGIFVWKSYQFFEYHAGDLYRMADPSPLLFSMPSSGIPADVYVAAPHGRESLLAILKELEKGSHADFTAIPNLVLPLPSGQYHFTRRIREEVDYDSDFTRWDLLDELPEQVPVRTSIGCPFRCRYCDFYQLYPEIFIRSKESLIHEIKMIRELPGGQSAIIHATDDNVFIHPKRVKEVTGAFSEAGVQKWIGFMRASSITPSNILDVQQSGLMIALIGMESGDKDQLKRMNKSLNLQAARQGIELLDKNGINALMTFIVGFPGESPETISNTAHFLNSLDIGESSSSYLLFPLMISPFSDLAKPVFREKWKINGNGQNWSHYTMNSDETRSASLELFRQVTRAPYHYTEERTYYNRMHFTNDQKMKLFTLRQMLTLAFIDHSPPKEIKRIFRAMANILELPEQKVADDFIGEIRFQSEFRL